MGSSERYHKFHAKKHPPQQAFLLDQFSDNDIRKWQAIKEDILKFYWDFHSELAYQRSKIIESINSSLIKASIKDFKFNKWQRAVKYKYSLDPLSTAGSLVDPGGRFNIGDIKPQFTQFPALYIAFDKMTALQELLSQNVKEGTDQEKQAFDFALTSTASVTNLSVSGALNSVIDLNKGNELQNFVDLIKNFKIPDHLKESAKKINLPSVDLVTSVSILVNALLDPNWRTNPMQFDVPATSQIFGHLAMEAGIEGIVYPSKFSGKDCLVIFPQNFEKNSKSLGVLHEKVVKKRFIIL